jgi:C-terminal processing protease CtpA/Prc
MKKATLSFFFAFTLVLANAQNKQQIIANETAFTRLYGYVRYFYPGDEAASINWNLFAIYGAKKVAGCTNRQALKQALTDLFEPIVPTLQLVDSGENVVFNKQSIIPPSLNGYKTVAWQHIGVNARALNYKESPYHSARTNRKIYFDPYPQKYGSFTNDLDITPYRNKEFILTGRLKMAYGTGGGHLVVRVITPNNGTGFYGNMIENPIVSTDWKKFEIRGKIDSNAQQLRIGAFLAGTGELWVDDVSVSVKQGTSLKKIYVNDFNKEKTGTTSRVALGDKSTSKVFPDFAYTIAEDEKNPGEKWLTIKSTVKTEVNHTSFFKVYPKVGEYITKNIGSGLRIMMPISLYGDDNHTYPMADAAKFSDLKNHLNDLSETVITADSLVTRLADLVISWNVFQHFFPYFDAAKTDWPHDLNIAFENAFADKDSYDFKRTLQKFTARLKDEHTQVYWIKDKSAFFPGITWEWVEGKLVVTKVLDKTTSLAKGDIITAIDNETPESHFKNVEQYISAATPGGLMDQAETQSLLGDKGTKLQLSFLNHNNVPGKAELIRTLTYNDHYNALSITDSINSIMHIKDNVMYINIGVADMKAINKALPELQKCKVIICDLRNDLIDNDNNHFIEYLLTQKDTAKHWMQTPHIIYPDQEKIIGYESDGFDLVPGKPHLNAKIIFLADGSDYSWAESYMSIIAHYKLATIIGQPTAGTNGDVNELALPGGYTINFSGLKVTQLDGSQHQGVGTKPDIYVAKTIKGMRENKDEFLDKAIELAETYNK